MFKNGPSSDLTANQVRDKLTEIAMKVLEENKKLGSGPKSQAYGEFRSRLTPDPKGNGGSEGFADFKHCSTSIISFLGCIMLVKALTVHSQNRSTEWYPCDRKLWDTEKSCNSQLTVQPTVLFDGLKEDSVSSSWGKEEWERFLS